MSIHVRMCACIYMYMTYMCSVMCTVSLAASKKRDIGEQEDDV